MLSRRPRALDRSNSGCPFPRPQHICSLESCLPEKLLAAQPGRPLWTVALHRTTLSSGWWQQSLTSRGPAHPTLLPTGGSLE